MRLTHNFRLALPLLGLFAAISLFACTGTGNENTPTPNTLTSTVAANSDSQSGDGTGILEVRVTDAPNQAITAIYLTASEIQVASADSEESWITVISDPTSFELLALQGVEAILGESVLPAGRYTQVRLSVPDVEVILDGESVIAEVPSDKIRLVGTFTIADGERTFIALDFDAEESLVQRGPNGFLFKPVIRLEVGQPGQAGGPTVDLPVKAEEGSDATPVPDATATQLATAIPEPSPTVTPDPIGAFFLSIESPEEPEVIVESAQFEVVGRTTVDAFVTVNDDVADVDADGRFLVSVELEEGPNIIEVVASTAGGDQDSHVLVVIYEP